MEKWVLGKMDVFCQNTYFGEIGLSA